MVRNNRSIGFAWLDIDNRQSNTVQYVNIECLSLLPRDTAGQRNFRTISKSYYAATKAFILIYDVTNVDTFDLIEQFHQFIEEVDRSMNNIDCFIIIIIVFFLSLFFFHCRLERIRY
jgi:hypothetical protein